MHKFDSIFFALHDRVDVSQNRKVVLHYGKDVNG